MVFVFDWDGTLGGHESKLSEKNKQVLKYLTEKGHTCIVATGRGTQNLLEQLDGETEYLARYIIGANGNLIYDVKLKKNIYFSLMNNDSVKKVVGFFKQYSKNVAFIGTFGTKFFRTAEQHPIKCLTENGYRMLNDVISDAKLNEIIDRICIIGISIKNVDISWLDQLKLTVSEFNDIKVVRPSRTWIQVTPKYVSKFSAIKLVMQKLNLENEKIIAFGDSDNDIEMISAADLGIAMGDASKSLKDKSDVVIKPASQNGIFDYIMKEY